MNDAAVRQAGQRVVVREVMDARLRRMAVANVAHDRHAQPLAVAHHRAHDELDRDALPSLVEHHAFVGRLLAARRSPQRPSRRGRARRSRAVLRPSISCERVAGELADRRVGVGDEAVLVEDDALGARLHELREPLLRFAHRSLGEAVLRDVGHQHERSRSCLPLGADVRQQVDLDPARSPSGVTARARSRPAGARFSMRSTCGWICARRLADHLGEGAGRGSNARRGRRSRA